MVAPVTNSPAGKIISSSRVSFNRDMLSKAMCSPMTVTKIDGKFVAQIDGQPETKVTDVREEVAIRKCNDILKQNFTKGQVAI
jgi:hypothetical protein